MPNYLVHPWKLTFGTKKTELWFRWCPLIRQVTRWLSKVYVNFPGFLCWTRMWSTKVLNTGNKLLELEFHVFHARPTPPAMTHVKGGFCSQISSGLGRKRAAEERRIDSMHLMNPNNDHHLVWCYSNCSVSFLGSWHTQGTRMCFATDWWLLRIEALS